MPNKITTADIREILSTREAVAAARKSLRLIEANLGSLEKNLINLLRVGVAVDSKTYEAIIAMEEGVCRPPWKDEYLDHMAEVHFVLRAPAEELVRERHPAEKREVLSIRLLKKGG